MSGSVREPLFQSRPQLVTVIVPVFNEARNIVDNLDLLLSEIEDHFQSFEILIISDGSKDGTNARVFQFKYPGLRLIIQEKNQGKGAAIRRGFAEAKGDYIFFIDGGMELHPKELRIFLGLMRLYDADIVIGSKRHPQSNVYYPWYRKFLSWCYQRLIRFLFEIDVTDTQVGMKLFRREVIDQVLPHMKTDRYGFDLELLSLAKIFGFTKMLEAPIELDYFERNKRFITVELMHVLRVGWSLLKDTWKVYRRIRHIRRERARAPTQGERLSVKG